MSDGSRLQPVHSASLDAVSNSGTSFNADTYLSRQSPNPLGQLPFLHRRYMQLCFCFPLPDGSLDSEIIGRLTCGLQRLASRLPWVAGQVVSKSSSDRNAGLFRLRPWKPHPELVVKDLRSDASVPTFSEMKAAQFPSIMLHQQVVSPCTTAAGASPSDPTVAPVFLMQATFIREGLLLTTAGEHTMMDITGYKTLIALLSRACNGQDFTDEEVTIGNMPRDTAIPLMHNWVAVLALWVVWALRAVWALWTAVSARLRKVTSKVQHLTEATCSCAYFTVPASALIELKAVASQNRTKATPYVSTDDALCAFFWKHITRARLARMHGCSFTATARTTLCRAVNGRTHLGVHPLYTGTVAVIAICAMSAQDVAAAPLSVIASRLRLALADKVGLARKARAFAAMVAASTKTDHRLEGSFASSLMEAKPAPFDLLISSWFDDDKLYCCDFGLRNVLGIDGEYGPAAVRVPRFRRHLDGWAVALAQPSQTRGKCDRVIGLMLQADDLQFLRTDPEFVRFASFVG